MKRPGWRGVFYDRCIKRMINSRSFKKQQSLTIYSRRSAILPKFLNRLVYIHTGKKFYHVRISKWMLNHKFGEFATTKKLGSTIHDSIRNRKRRAKMKQKL